MNSKKLILRKSTVTHLDASILKDVKGGTGYPAPSWTPECYTENCDYYTVIDCPTVNCM